MPRRDFERAKIELKTIETQIAFQLRGELRKVLEGESTLLFFNQEYNPHKFPENVLLPQSDELLQLSRRSLELRKLLVLSTKECIGRLYEAACIDSADLDNPHRLGPVRLAARLLAQLEESCKETT